MSGAAKIPAAIASVKGLPGSRKAAKAHSARKKAMPLVPLPASFQRLTRLLPGPGGAAASEGERDGCSMGGRTEDAGGGMKPGPGENPGPGSLLDSESSCAGVFKSGSPDRSMRAGARRL